MVRTRLKMNARYQWKKNCANPVFGGVLRRCARLQLCWATGFDAGIMKTQDLPASKPALSGRIESSFFRLLGIAYLTLFPFHFDFAPTCIFHRYPFLLETSVKRPHVFGFFSERSLVCSLRIWRFRSGVQAGRTVAGFRFFWRSLAGAGVSYTVEVLQFYIPARDSGWEDVISNSMGSLAGFLSLRTLRRRCPGG